MARHGTLARTGLARHGTEQGDTDWLWHGTARTSVARHGMARHRHCTDMARHGTDMTRHDTNLARHETDPEWVVALARI